MFLVDSPAGTQQIYLSPFLWYYIANPEGFVPPNPIFFLKQFLKTNKKKNCHRVRPLWFKQVWGLKIPRRALSQGCGEGAQGEICGVPLGQVEILVQAHSWSTAWRAGSRGNTVQICWEEGKQRSQEMYIGDNKVNIREVCLYYTNRMGYQ